MRRRFYAELALAAASCFLLALTLAWRDWMEIVFHTDPDHGNGAVEWGLVGAQVAFTVFWATLAITERGRPQRVHARVDRRSSVDDR